MVLYCLRPCPCPHKPCKPKTEEELEQARTKAQRKRDKYRARRLAQQVGATPAENIHETTKELRADAKVSTVDKTQHCPANFDNRRFLHVVYRVGDLERTIKFYTECFGMKLSRQRDIHEEKYSNAFLGFGPETSNFVVELTYNYGVSSYDIGTGFGHFAISTQDVYKIVEAVRAKGGNVTREPGPVKGGTSIIAFVKDPDGYTFELIQRWSNSQTFYTLLRILLNFQCGIFYP